MSDVPLVPVSSPEGSLSLHYFENTQLILSVPAIGCITFYKSLGDGTSSTSSRSGGRKAQSDVVQFLRRRVDEIVRLNPWLCGRIVRDEGGTRIVFPRVTHAGGENKEEVGGGGDAAGSRRYFEVVEDYDLGPHLSYEQIRDRVKPLSVKEGFQCLLPGELMFRVTIVLTGPESLAIVCSVSHVIADGHTFYELYGMLSRDAQARELVAKRNMLFKPLYEAITEGDDSTRWLFSLGATLKMVFTLAFGRKTHTSLRLINLAAIGALKEIFASSIPEGSYVSTNDILTSWLFLKCKSHVGIMAFNVRGRLAELTNDHAGNYEGLISYQPADFRHPLLIRKSLEMPYKRRVTPQLPGFLGSIRSRVTMVSSWATFYRDVEVAEFKQILHLPCIDDKTVPLDNVGFLFRPRRDALALLLIGRSVSPAALDADPIVAGHVLEADSREDNKKHVARRAAWNNATTWALVGAGAAACVAAVYYTRSFKLNK